MSTRIARRNPGLSVDWYPAELPSDTGIELRTFETVDGSASRGVLYTPAGRRPSAAIVVMHPRVDMTRHYLIPTLLAGGYAVWAQTSREPNNDLRLVHEQALLDLAPGIGFLRDRDFATVVALGNSGGAGLLTYYHQQASRPSDERVATTPAGRPVPLADAAMSPFDGVVYLAPHPGQGALLLGCIDPSVVDEDDPLSVDPALDPYDEHNGFVPGPASSSYPEEFTARYRAAQLDRVRRIDERARASVADSREARGRAADGGDRDAARRSVVARIMCVYRTDADLRSVDLSLDPSDRAYGSVFGRRPDLTNYGPLGFARLTTPEAWLSTWSALSSNALLAKTAPDVRVPVLILPYTGDNTVYPSDIASLQQHLGADDVETVPVAGDHYGHPLDPAAGGGREQAASVMLDWLAARFPLRRS